MLFPNNNFALDILQSIHLQEKKPPDGPPRGANGGPVRPPGGNFLKTPSLITLYFTMTLTISCSANEMVFNMCNDYNNGT